MTDEEIASQTGISDSYSTVQTDTMLTTQLLTNGGSALNGSMALALDNSDNVIGQMADFSSTTGKKKVTLEGGDQSVIFNKEGGNVVVIESDSTGEKNVTLGGGGDLVIIKGTTAPVNITTASNKDTIVTSGGDVLVDMAGAAKIIPNSGNVTLNNYNSENGAGIQVNSTADIQRAIENGNISLSDGKITFGDTTVNLGNEETESTIVNLFNNQGVKQKVAYTNSEGGNVDASGERENMLLVGNNSGNSRFMAGSGGAGDYFDLGGGNNYVSLSTNRNFAETEATIAMTAENGQTEVDGFNFSYGESGDKVRLDISTAQVSFKDGVVTFTSSNGSKLILNGNSASSADLIDDDNFIGNTTLDEITPITYEQGDYQFATTQDTISTDVQITFAQG